MTDLSTPSKRVEPPTHRPHRPLWRGVGVALLALGAGLSGCVVVPASGHRGHGGHGGHGGDRGEVVVVVEPPPHRWERGRRGWERHGGEEHHRHRR
jgi:hypothetical protein